MKKLIILFALLCLPLSARADEPAIYRDALGLMGVHLVNAPLDQSIYQKTWEVFDKFNKGQQFNLTIWYTNQIIDCGYGFTAVGCYWPTYRLIEIVEHSAPRGFTFVLFHEYAHSTGIYDEGLADKFASEHLK